MKNKWLIVAGGLNLFTAFLHVIGGQITLINPLLETNLELSTKTELLGAWHIVSVILFATSLLFLYVGFNRNKSPMEHSVLFSAYLYLLFGITFIVLNLIYMVLAPQWILLLPIGILGIIGVKKTHSQN